jgi:hypothetical protein
MRLNAADQRVLVSGKTVFGDIALATAPQNFNLTGSGEPERVVAARLSSNFLPVLRVRPVLGRAFTAEDEQGGGSPVVLISDGLWKRRFGGDPAIIGRTINLSGNPYEVIGVMPPGFQFPALEHQLWVPLTINPRVLTRQIANRQHRGERQRARILVRHAGGDRRGGRASSSHSVLAHGRGKRDSWQPLRHRESQARPHA